MKSAPPKGQDRSKIRHGLAIVAIFAAAFVLIRFGGPTLSALLAAATSSIGDYDAVAYLTPYDESPTLKVGDTAKVDVDINSKIPVNAIGATLTFPVDAIEIVSISKERSFMDLWTEETAINEEKGEVHFSGGTTKKGGVSGVATALTLNVRAKKPGSVEIKFKDAQMFPSNGSGEPLSSATRSYSLSVAQTPPSSGAGGGAGGSANIQDAPPPGPPQLSADFDSNGKVTLADATRLVLHFIRPYDPRFDLNRDGRIDWGDVGEVFQQMR